MSAPWASLPELPLLHAASFLGPNDVTRASRVCRNWHATLLSDALWRPLCAAHWLHTEAAPAGTSYYHTFSALHRQYGRFKNYRAIRYAFVSLSTLVHRDTLRTHTHCTHSRVSRDSTRLPQCPHVHRCIALINSSGQRGDAS